MYQIDVCLKSGRENFVLKHIRAERFFVRFLRSGIDGCMCRQNKKTKYGAASVEKRQYEKLPADAELFFWS